MADVKKLKDPIYGYIAIPVEYMNKIIDTAPFQRLRRIIQTSYAPLYSSAVHNRFVHSMGVFYLGEIVRKQLESAISNSLILNQKIKKNKLKRIGKVFSLACLLHDVGHAPFSHTGEAFYLRSLEKKVEEAEKKQAQYFDIHKKLIDIVNRRTFTKDIKSVTSYAAPHEIISAYVGLKEYSDFFADDKEKEFFARCITGYLYSDKSKSLENCYISMLNSEVIDVDKLDYLVRDAYITGFDTVCIDFVRLLNSVTLFYNEKMGQFEIAFYKSAISVIENVIYAHDAERKWIQTHPVVLYDGYLINHMIEELNRKFDEKLFSVEAISSTGHVYTYDSNKSVRIRLLCDDDIIFLSKSLLDDSLIDEYFERNTRRHPLWKSEAEYNAYIEAELEGVKLEQVKDAITIMLDSLEGKRVYSIDSQYIEEIEREIERLRKLEGDLDSDTYKAQMKGKSEIKKICDGLKKYAAANHVEPDYVFLKTTQFSSGFGKTDFSNIGIVFDKSGQQVLKRFGKIVNTLNFDSGNKEYYYIYSKHIIKKSVDHKNIYSYLVREFI